jgi:uncharacterized membrane protein
MKTLKTFSLLIMTAFYAVGGINHFVNPQVYPPMMPPYLPMPEVLHLVAGGVEIAVAIMFWIAPLRRWAAYVTIALLAAFLTVHVYHLQLGAFPGNPDIPTWGLWVRLVFQGLFMAWAWWHRK